jgi:hypothetical protein
MRGRPVERQMENMECNATSAVQITHHFLKKMVSRCDAACCCCHLVWLVLWPCCFCLSC